MKALVGLSASTRRMLGVALLALPMGGQSATSTGSLSVSATVVSACVVSGSTLNFGNSIDPTVASVPIDVNSSITVQCSSSTNYAVSLDAGQNAGGATNFSARAIKNGSSTLGYQLYTDNAHTTVWGNGTGSSTVSGVGNGSNQTLTVHGRLPSLSGAVPGGYSDTVTITITY